MALQVFLHIGTEKTGTTSLQNFLTANRDVLIGSGILYPGTLGKKSNHVKLAIYAANRTRGLGARIGLKDDNDLVRFRNRTQAAFLEEVAMRQPDKIILSNEHCHSRLRTIEEIERVRYLLEKLTGRPKVVIYFRRQDRMAVSFYTTRLIAGHAPKTILPVSGMPSYYYDFLSIFENWARVFGPENIIPRIYRRDVDRSWDIVEDLRDLASLPSGISYKRPAIANESLSVLGQEYVRTLNVLLKDAQEAAHKNKIQEFRRFLIRTCKGQGARPAREDARRFYSNFIPSNAKLADKWRPSKVGHLFDDDFSMYPETADTLDKNVSDAMQLASQFLLMQETSLKRPPSRRQEAE